MTLPIPTPVPFAPLGNVRQSQAYVADPNLGNPYVQSWTLGIERQVLADWQLDVSYVGNHAVGMWRGSNFNQTEIRDNGFLDAFKIAQANLAANGDPAVGQSLGALQALFKLTPSSQYNLIAQGQVGSLANYYDTTSFSTGTRGGLLQEAGLPVTFFRFNPQVVDLDIIGNRSHSTFHGLKFSANRRFSDGLYLQANYTFGKVLSDAVPGQNLADDYHDNRNHSLDKALSELDSTHVVLVNGIWEIPIGRGRRYLAGSRTLVDALLGGWQVNGIFNFTTGRPVAIHTGRRFLNNTVNSTLNFSGGFDNLSTVYKGDQIRYIRSEDTGLFSNPWTWRAGRTAPCGSVSHPGRRAVRHELLQGVSASISARGGPNPVSGGVLQSLQPYQL